MPGMRNLSVFLFLFLAFACSKDDDPEKFTSINGYWVVRSPDNETTVTFRIGVDPDNKQVINAAFVNHNGADYNSQPINSVLVVTSATQIESITFLTDQIVIRFLELSANSEFTEMDIANSSFRIDGVFREFAMIKATRP